MQSRRLPVLWVVLLSQACGLRLVVVAARGPRHRPAALNHLLPALGGGLAGLLGLAAFYRALAIGTMSIVAPIAAAGMALPVVGRHRRRRPPGPVRLVGMAMTVAGVILASREAPRSRAPAAAARAEHRLALVAALGFGAFALGLRVERARGCAVGAARRAACGCLLPLAAVLAAAPGRGPAPAAAHLGPIAVDRPARRIAPTGCTRWRPGTVC